MHPSSDLGRFPQTCLEELGESAPSFTEAEWKLIKGSSELYVPLPAFYFSIQFFPFLREHRPPLHYCLHRVLRSEL